MPLRNHRLLYGIKSSLVRLYCPGDILHGFVTYQKAPILPRRYIAYFVNKNPHCITACTAQAIFCMVLLPTKCPILPRRYFAWFCYLQNALYCPGDILHILLKQILYCINRLYCPGDILHGFVTYKKPLYCPGDILHILLTKILTASAYTAQAIYCIFC